MRDWSGLCRPGNDAEVLPHGRDLMQGTLCGGARSPLGPWRPPAGLPRARRRPEHLAPTPDVIKYAIKRMIIKTHAIQRMIIKIEG